MSGESLGGFPRRLEKDVLLGEMVSWCERRFGDVSYFPCYVRIAARMNMLEISSSALGFGWRTEVLKAARKFRFHLLASTGST